MIGSLLAAPRGLARLVAAGPVVACAVVACAAGGCAAAGQPGPPPSHQAQARASQPPRPHPSVSGLVPAVAVPPISGDPQGLAGQLTAAESALAGNGASPSVLARQALTVQLACLRVALHPGWAAAVTGRVAPAQRASAAADIAATAELVALTPPAVRLPHWRIVTAQKLAKLKADYQAAQAATGVGWRYLAAINFVETDFGRIVGPSSAGAQGPMQFMPATWASYGHGSIHSPRDAIFAAARFLAAHGAAVDIGSALYAYNPSSLYVRAVLRYARRMRADPAALTGYYSRQVIYRLGRGWVLLPAGYGISPTVRAVRLPL